MRIWYRLISLWTALMLVLSATSCQTGRQLTYLDLKRLEYQQLALNRPIMEAKKINAEDMKVYGPTPPLDPPRDPLKTWTEFGQRLATLGLMAFGLHRLSRGGDHNTTINNNAGAEAAP